MGGQNFAHVTIDLVNKEKRVVVELYISDDRKMFDALFEKKDVIENSLGFKMNEWAHLNDKKHLGPSIISTD